LHFDLIALEEDRLKGNAFAWRAIETKGVRQTSWNWTTNVWFGVDPSAL